MAYKDFEGEIPKGHYGAGDVIIWDRGTYKNLAPVSMKECVKDGQLTVFLYGKKLRGGFAFVRMENRDDQWLFIKMRDEYADARRKPVVSQPESIISGKKIKKKKRSK
jgi:DNA ligase D-like protein (predicted 3'-phosphoesterase)